VSKAGVAVWQRTSKVDGVAIVTALAVGEQRITSAAASPGKIDLGNSRSRRLPATPARSSRSSTRQASPSGAGFSARTSADVVTGISVDPGARWWSSHFGNTIDFGGVRSAPHKGLQDGFVAKLDATGAGLWSMSFTLR
jgi:hypothetical protein